jgi:hypothetical protein
MWRDWQLKWTVGFWNIFGDHCTICTAGYDEKLNMSEKSCANCVGALHAVAHMVFSKERFLMKSEVIKANEPKSSIKNNNSTQNWEPWLIKKSTYQSMIENLKTFTTTTEIKRLLMVCWKQSTALNAHHQCSLSQRHIKLSNLLQI